MLQFINISKEAGSTRIIGKFSLDIKAHQCTCLKCNSEIRRFIVDLILGNKLASFGEVLYDGVNVYKNHKLICENFDSIVVGDGIYDRLKVMDYLNFFAGISNVKFDKNEILKLCGLLDKDNVKISKLTDGEKYRVKLARCGLRMPKVILLEEPHQNIDIESLHIADNFIKEMIKKGITVIIITSSFDEVIMFADEAYSIDNDGIKKIDFQGEEVQNFTNNQTNEKENNNSSSENNEENPNEISNSPTEYQLKIEKIPAKVDSKIILFNPTEINYIESNDGNTLIHVGEESFLCNFTMTELEERLKNLGFFRSHRSYIVNLQRVREVVSWSKNSYILILSDINKTNIPLSKGKYEELKGIFKF